MQRQLRMIDARVETQLYSLLIFLYNRNISSDKLEIQCIFNYDAGKPFQHDISFSYQ